MKLGEEGMIGLVALLRNNLLPVLEELHLKKCHLGEKELLHLNYAAQDGYCKTIRRLDLSSNGMKQTGIVAIRPMFCEVYLPLLEVLDLSDNKLGNNGITELGSAPDLKLLNQVKTLYLCHNQITDEGASCIYLSIRNRIWKNMEQLDLNGNQKYDGCKV